MTRGADRGLRATRIRRQLETSLRRLGLERVALYIAHDFDPDVPQEETLLAFDELVRAGIVGAVGASNFTADQLAEALELSALEGLPATSGCRTRSRCSSRTTGRRSSRSATSTASGTRPTARSRAAG